MARGLTRPGTSAFREPSGPRLAAWAAVLLFTGLAFGLVFARVGRRGTRTLQVAEPAGTASVFLSMAGPGLIGIGDRSFVQVDAAGTIAHIGLEGDDRLVLRGVYRLVQDPIEDPDLIDQAPAIDRWKAWHRAWRASTTTGRAGHVEPGSETGP